MNYLLMVCPTTGFILLATVSIKHWKWLDEFCLDPTASAWNWYDVLGAGYGDAYIPSNTALRALFGGGYWHNGVHDGSRAVNASAYPWHVNGNIGVWCVCDAQ